MQMTCNNISSSTHFRAASRAPRQPFILTLSGPGTSERMPQQCFSR